MKVAILGDTHFGVRNDSDVFLDYTFDFFDRVFFPTLTEKGVDTVVQLGDMMDKRKTANYKTVHAVATRFFDRFKKSNGFRLITFPGNHDTYYRNSIEINSISELFGWMNESEDYNVNIITKPTTIEELDADFIPWIASDNEKEALEMISKAASSWCFGHFEIKGFEYNAGLVAHEGLQSDIFGGYKQVFSGHYHHRSSSRNITYVGTPYQLTWADYEDPRGFHIFDTETGDIEFVENTNVMFHKIFYDSDIDYSDFPFADYANKFVKVIVGNIENRGDFEWFIRKLEAINPFDLSVVESDIIVAKGIDEETVDGIDSFALLNDVSKKTAEDKNLNPTIMSKLLADLYKEAIELENSL